MGDGSREIALVELLLTHGANVYAEAKLFSSPTEKRMPLQVLLGPVNLDIPFPQLSGAPGEYEETLRRTENSKRTKQKIIAMLQKHGAH